MLFLVAYQNKGKNLIKIGLDDGKEKWATTSAEVYDYAKKNFTSKEEVEYDMTVKNGQYHIEAIYKKGQKGKTVAPKEEVERPTLTKGFKCEECGKELKDGKYKKCYTCNKKNPSTSKPKAEASTTENKYTCSVCGKTLKDGKYKTCFGCKGKDVPASKAGGQRDVVGKSIEKQAMMKASADAVGNAFVGQIGDVNTLADMIIKVYEKLLAKLTE